MSTTDPTAQAVYRFLLHKTTRYVFAWLVALCATSITLHWGWTLFDSPRREDGTFKRAGGNYGHTLIDFGGQWLLGKMVVEGQGHHLYHRNYQWPIVREALPR